MTYAAKKKEFSRFPIEIVEIDLDYCSNSFGVSPCTGSGTGDDKCYNCKSTCKDLPNYAETSKTYRFCESVEPHPIGLDAMPYLLRANTYASEIDISGGLGVRASISISFSNEPHSDIGVDPYVSERSYNPLDRGTFWTKLRARNPNYQNRPLRHLSGYLNSDGTYDPENFETRYYIINKLNANSSGCNITATDPLKLASEKKAQAPKPSNGVLKTAISSSDTSAELNPTGIGSEYASSGWVCIGSEVMSFTRSGDDLTLVRGQKNTVASAHKVNDTVQECLEYSGATRGKLDFIINDLATNFALIDTSYIPLTEWAAEVDTYLPGLLDRLIPKPTDVNKLLMELSSAAPHYLYWNERDAKVKLEALKAPPTGADVLDDFENFVGDSFTTIDKTDMRYSTIFVHFGQFDPTKKSDDPSNYDQTHVRVDTDSIVTYETSQVKEIFCPWISNTNKAAALKAAALLGRRFKNFPREISFALDAKDSDLWLGQSRAVRHNDIPDDTGNPVDTVFQIISAKAAETYQYTALEYTYGDSLPEDEGGSEPGIDLVVISQSERNINLRSIYDGLFSAPDGSTEVKFIIEDGVIVGSNSTSSYSLDTGSWPSGAIVTLQKNSGSITGGKGGEGDTINGPGGEDGGDAIILNHDLILINNGVIGGGAGGGGFGVTFGPSGNLEVAGSGGAGDEAGIAASGTAYYGSGTVIIEEFPLAGTLEFGGARGRYRVNDGGLLFASGGAGGDLGQAGQSGTGLDGSSSGGAAGVAINRNGYTLTETVSGDIRGAIVG